MALPVTMWTLTSSRAPVSPTGAPMPFLLVDDEVLRQHVQDLAARRERDRPRRVNRAPHVVARHLAVLAGDRHDAAAVEALDVRAADAEVHRADLDAGHQLGFLDRPLDRLDGRVEVDDDAALEPFDSATPRPMTSTPPSSRSSPTTVQTFDVPMSSPTT